RKFGSPIVDLVQPMPYIQRQRLLDGGFAEHGVQRYWKSGFIDTFDDALIDVLIDAAAHFPSPMSAIACYMFHGVTARVKSDATAYALREQLWDVNVVAQWIHDSDSESHISWTRAAWKRIEPLTKGTTYINHLALDDRPERLRSSFAGNYDRLVAV